MNDENEQIASESTDVVSADTMIETTTDTLPAGAVNVGDELVLVSAEAAVESRMAIKADDPEAEPLTDGEYRARKEQLAYEEPIKFDLVIRTNSYRGVVPYAIDLDKLPHAAPSGPNRGAAVEKALASSCAIVPKLVLSVDDIWLSQLMTGSDMAAGVWKSIASRVLGPKTHTRIQTLTLTTKTSEMQYGAVPSSWLVRTESKMRAESAKAPTQPKRKYYIVQAGDTLTGIALKVLGDASRYTELVEINGVENPDLIYPKQKLYLPTDAQWPPKREPKAKSESKAPVKAKVASSKASDNRQQRPPYARTSKIQDDLYLLCKGEYGVQYLEPENIVNAARAVVEFHTGALVVLATVVTNLFGTVTSYANRGYWGGYGFLQTMVFAGGDSKEALIRALQNQITSLPTSDLRVPAPVCNEKLVDFLANSIKAK